MNELLVFLLSVFITGFIADSFGSYNPAFYLEGSVQILAVGILFLTQTSCQTGHADITSTAAQDIRVENRPVAENITVL